MAINVREMFILYLRIVICQVLVRAYVVLCCNIPLLECSLFTTTRGFLSPLFLCRSADLKHYICIAFCGTLTCTFERLPEPLPINSQITWKIRKKITTITNTIPCSLLYRAQFFNIIALTVKLTHALEHSQKVDELARLQTK